jgi:hypothetical protein
VLAVLATGTARRQSPLDLDWTRSRLGGTSVLHGGAFSRPSRDPPRSAATLTARPLVGARECRVALWPGGWLTSRRLPARPKSHLPALQGRPCRPHGSAPGGPQRSQASGLIAPWRSGSDRCDYFPAFLDLRGRHCLWLVVGRRRAQGPRSLGVRRRSHARQPITTQGSWPWLRTAVPSRRRAFRGGDVRGCSIVIAATGATCDSLVADEASVPGPGERRRPAASLRLHRAIGLRVVSAIAVSTGGAPPALVREIRGLEPSFPQLGDFASGRPARRARHEQSPSALSGAGERVAAAGRPPGRGDHSETAPARRRDLEGLEAIPLAGVRRRYAPSARASVRGRLRLPTRAPTRPEPTSLSRARRRSGGAVEGGGLAQPIRNAPLPDE